jgi:hypothetical protein
MPRACGASSTLRLRGSIIDVSGILVHPPSRVMTAGCVARDHSFAISPHLLREFYPDRSALSYQRAQGMPGARCARSRACSVESTRVSHHGHTGNTRHSPRNGLRLTPRSPRGPGSFAPVTFAEIASHESLTPASGCQDHTTSPSASGALVCVAISVHRIPLHVRDDRETPLLVRRDDPIYSCFYRVVKLNSEIQK